MEQNFRKLVCFRHREAHAQSLRISGQDLSTGGNKKIYKKNPFVTYEDLYTSIQQKRNPERLFLLLLGAVRQPEDSKDIQ
jgi:hypothetical protein